MAPVGGPWSGCRAVPWAARAVSTRRPIPRLPEIGCRSPSSARKSWTLRPSIQGLTLSGGEPLQQLPALLAFLETIRRASDLSVLLFSGYTWAEIQRMPRHPQLLSLIDVLIAGRYDPTQRVAHGLVGSHNKTVHFLTERYTPADLARRP